MLDARPRGAGAPERDTRFLVRRMPATQGMAGGARRPGGELDVITVIAPRITRIEALERSPVFEAECITLVMGIVHAEGGEAGVIAVDHVEQQATVGELVERQRPLGQNRRRQLARVLRHQKAQALGGVDQRGGNRKAFVGAGAEQRAVVAEAIAGDRELFEVLKVGFPATFGFPRIRSVRRSEVPENFYSHDKHP